MFSRAVKRLPSRAANVTMNPVAAREGNRFTARENIVVISSSGNGQNAPEGKPM